MLELLDRYRHKIKSAEELRDIIGPRPRKKRVIMCHGVFDVVHPGLPEGDTGMQLPLSRTDDVPHVGPAERHEQQPGLVHMVAVAVHHDNLSFVQVVYPPQPVGGQRAAGSPA